MTRKLVWALAFSGVVLSGVVLAAGTVAAQQYRGYGYSYDAAPGYYDGGYGGGPYGGQGFDPYGPPPGGRGAYQGAYNNDPDPGEPGYRPRSGATPDQPSRGQTGPQGNSRDDTYGDRGFGGRDYGYGYDQGPGYGEPYDGREPGRRASDDDLGENANRTTVTEVENTTHQPPGTIVINTTERHLYLTQANGQALQYGIGVGREGFTWKGSAHVQRKSEWPTWTPPAEMLKRRPDLPTHMQGGIENPLGARALYLFNGKGDTGYRIHGTNEPDTIGKAVSSGCIRMMNADVIDLYRRVSVGTKVVVL